MRYEWMSSINDFGIKKRFGFYKNWKFGKRCITLSLFKYKPYADFQIKVEDSNVCKDVFTDDGWPIPMGKTFTFSCHTIYFSVDFWMF